VTPRIGTKAWFGPKWLGWGWSPVSVEGWLVTFATIGLPILGAVIVGEDNTAAMIVVAVAAVGGLLAATYLKGTSPGGYRQHEAFRRHQPRGRP
jgi:hypothetical protein